MKIKKDPMTGVLYLRLRGGQIDDTIPWPGWDESVYLDLDKEGTVLGVEFLSSEELDQFLEEYPQGLEIPERIENPTAFFAHISGPGPRFGEQRY